MSWAWGPGHMIWVCLLDLDFIHRDIPLCSKIGHSALIFLGTEIHTLKTFHIPLMTLHEPWA